MSDVERAKEFYRGHGWRLDVTPPWVVQLTPPGSACSVHFGANVTSAAPGSAMSYVIVADIVAARDGLLAAGVDVDEINHAGPDGRSAAWIRSGAATSPAPRSAIPTATPGCCRRSRPGCPVASTPPRPRSTP
ncbi:MAG TPA: VOC family protein [Actinophytocola sp.]|nr:VOC family protein [Actinophytocola sp.]